MTDHEAIQNIHRRMDSQDKLLLEIRDTITTHLAEEKKVGPAIDELITLYKGSKMLIPMLATIAVALWGMFEWAKAHIK